MTFPIIQDFIPAGRRNRPAHAMTPKFITIHDTANTRSGASAKNHAAYLKSAAANLRGASWHFTVDGGTRDGKVAPEIYQHLPLTENGWHAGDGRNGPGNRKSIGIEICENSNGNRTRAEDATAWLTAKLLNDFKLPVQAVRQHHDWSRKNCPRVLRGRQGGWAGFLAAVKNYMIPVVYEAAYIVQSGDTMSEIAVAHKVPLQRLISMNPHITNPGLIVPGQRVYVPGLTKREDPAPVPVAEPTPAASKGLWVVQVGAFRDRKNAEETQARLRVAGYDAVIRRKE